MTVQLLKGRVAVRETKRRHWFLATPDGNPRDERWHRGRVIEMGPPSELANGTPVPWGFDVGEEVVWTFHHHEKARTVVWPDDGVPVVLLTQQEIHAVIEPSP